jgi:iron complex transport system ATP-binding protein
VAVLHDLNQACRYAAHLIAMKDGAVIARRALGDIVTADLVEEVFGLRYRVVPDPESGTPMVVPRIRQRRPRRDEQSPVLAKGAALD